MTTWRDMNSVIYYNDTKTNYNSEYYYMTTWRDMNSVIDIL